MKMYFFTICIFLNFAALFACEPIREPLSIGNVKYISMVPQYVPAPKIATCIDAIKAESKSCTQLKEHVCYIDTSIRGRLDIQAVRRNSTIIPSDVAIVDNLLHIFSVESFEDPRLFRTNITLMLFRNRYKSLSTHINGSLLATEDIPVPGENCHCHLRIMGTCLDAWGKGSVA